MLCSGESNAVLVDLTLGTRTATVTERIFRSAAWAEGAASDAVTVVEVNGVPLGVSEGSGFIDWMPPSNGVYVLTHRVMSHGIQIGDTLTATFEVTLPPGIVVEVGVGKLVTVPQTWLDEHPAIVAAAAGDKVAALNTPSANGRLSNVECYVLGLDPTSETNDFKIVSFPIGADGKPDLSAVVFAPPKDKWNVQSATPVLKGAESLNGDWKAVDEAREEEKSKMRFFKVEVVLP